MTALLKRLARALLPAPLACRLAVCMRERRNRRFKSRIVRQRYCGFELSINLADAMAVAWYRMPWPDDCVKELSILKQRKLRPGACVFDIGAHQAVVALVLSKIVGPSGRVVAVEADPLTAQVAQSNKELNAAENLTIVPAAVGSGGQPPSGTSRSNNDRSYDWSLQKVKFITLQQLVSEHGMPDVVYLDVDGFECQVLAGAKDLLASAADWYVEIHAGAELEIEGGTWQEVLACFPPEKYERLIASEKQPEYRPFSPDSELMKERFFLLALHRS